MADKTERDFAPGRTRKIILVGVLAASTVGMLWWNRPRAVVAIPPVFSFITSRNADGLRSALARNSGAVREIDLDGNTVLHEAAVTGNPDLVEIVLGSGADPNAVNARGETPLLSALVAPRNSLRTVTLLLKAGADPKRTLPHSESILHVAARIPSLDPRVIALLVKQPEQLEAADDSGKTPLQLARESNNTRFLAAVR